MIEMCECVCLSLISDSSKVTLVLTVDKATLQRRCTYSQNLEGRKGDRRVSCSKCNVRLCLKFITTLRSAKIA